MNESEAMRMLQELQHQDPATVQTWLMDIWQGRRQAPADFNWLGLAQSAAVEARASLSLPWTQVTLSIYESTQTPAYDQNSAMMLRAYLIRHIGARRGDAILDPAVIVRWFFDNLPLSREEAEQRARNWQDLPIAQIKTLRQIKNRLSVLHLLAEQHLLDAYPELASWLELRDRLP